MIIDITSAVGFKAVNALESGCDVTGGVYASSGEMVTSFKSIHKGMGKFFLRPVQGVKYYAIVRNSVGETIRRDIPESFSSGVVLNASNYKDIAPLVTISTNPGTLPLISDQELSLTISAREKIFKILNFRINSLFTSFRLPAEDLPDGIIQLTLSGPDELPLCERLIFLSNKNASIELTTDKQVYRKRDSVSVKIQLSGDPVFADQAFLSLSATEKIYLLNDSSSRSTISSWFLLESDIRGPVEDPSDYFDPVNAERYEDMDLLLCTQGWRDFEWKYKNPQYLPENGFSVSGRVKKLFSRQPLINSSVTAILKTYNNEIIATSSTDSSGTFRFEEFDFTGNARLIASTIGEKDKLQGHLILDSLRYIPEKVQVNESGERLLVRKNLVGEDNLTKLEQKYEINRSIKKKYTLSDTIMLGEVEIFSQQKQKQVINYQRQRTAVGLPDNVIEMTPQLENRTDIRDVLRGMVASLPLTWIERIEILKSGGIATTMTREQGDDEHLKSNGVISVITKSEVERKDKEKPVFHSVNKIISGYDVPRIFYSPAHSSDSDSSNMPDLRSTLFWEPNIIVAGNENYVLSYFNADNQATVIVTVEGMTSGGIPVTGRLEYVIE